MSLKQLVTDGSWKDYFKSFSGTHNVELNIFSEDGTRLFSANENPYCTFFKQLQTDSINCTVSCKDFVFNSTQTNGPVFNKCNAHQARFTFAIEKSGERLFVQCIGGFATYEDLLSYIATARENSLSGIPVNRPLTFPGENHLKSLSDYIHLSVNRFIHSMEDKSKHDEKIMRMTSLFDSQAFGTLSRNPELMYRYILDTIEFVFGNTSSVLLLPDRESRLFHASCSAGTFKDQLMGYKINPEDAHVRNMMTTGSSVSYEDNGALAALCGKERASSSHLFPLVIGGALSAVIAIVDKELSREDVKIMNAFRDYVQLNLENRRLLNEVKTKQTEDRKATSFSDYTSSLAAITEPDKLFDSLLQKTIQLLEAEQGSLMLLDQDTSELVVEARRCYDDIVQEKMRLRCDEGIAGQVLEQGTAILVEDIEKDPRINKANRPRYKTKSFLSVPIKIEKNWSGVLNISDKTEGRTFSKDDQALVESFIETVAGAIERSILYRKTEELRKLSITDPLTGIYNRRYLNRRLSEEITRYNRYKHPFSFMMLDLDKFKDYNDTYGHISGDELIKFLAQIIEKSLRTIDIAARFGGDEFVAIFPQTPKVDAIQITNRLKEKIDQEMKDNYSEMPLNVSMGLATFPDDASSIMELIEKTDQALYLAKKGGGNRIIYL